ncbi:hypothetical protein A3B33_00375 [Candidatus Adlerbacteria bacterium RIFCSPLOWO2_01_FULL_54_16]|uniref:Uncharacterized protein n=1 Tax=Candidatus Adlerbacteria bacterium RIFCSPLOWO2_01_FULL_54_16 TaxID=1797244 RepID=A0A1F4XZB4_9BACT|nr:MAG: hypothetical protein A3B33_00375 [Candidatus Adlerbacteria bacterium RIFCSPLOWO2_01_FULL_54_16]
MIVCALAALPYHKRRVHHVFFERGDAFVAVLVLSYIGAQGGLESEPRRGDSGVSRVADRRDFDVRLEGYLIPPSHAYFAILVVDVAMHPRILKPDEIVDGSVAHREKIHVFSIY